MTAALFGVNRRSLYEERAVARLRDTDQAASESCMSSILGCRSYFVDLTMITGSRSPAGSCVTHGSQFPGTLCTESSSSPRDFRLGGLSDAVLRFKGNDKLARTKESGHSRSGRPICTQADPSSCKIALSLRCLPTTVSLLRISILCQLPVALLWIPAYQSSIIVCHDALLDCNSHYDCSACEHSRVFTNRGGYKSSFLSPYKGNASLLTQWDTCLT